MPAPAAPLSSGCLERELRLPPLLSRCLVNRGLTEPSVINDFLQPRLKQLRDPFEIPGMEKAVERLLEARKRAEDVVVFGDYDVDGVTSTTILLEVLHALGWKVDYYLPHRVDDGYGLNMAAISKCLAKVPARLMLAVDCGSTAVGPIAWLADQGVDVLVLDHHQVSDPAPCAKALVNPLVAAEQTVGSTTLPFAELCSAGLAFKLAHALVKRGREAGIPGAAEYDLRPLLDLVALGTVADIVPLVRENRILVSAGLARLETTTRPGLIALKALARCARPVGVYDVGFLLGPRLNAAGRLETADTALRLLRAREEDEALALARALDTCNQERQQLERQIAEEAVESIRASFDPARDLVIVEGREAWHVGVVGIVAARVLHQFYRPTIIVGGDENEWRGSGRSIAGFDLAAALRECDDLLVRHGGHAMAAGVSVEPAKLGLLRQRLNEIARRRLGADSLKPQLRLDAQVTLQDLSLSCVVSLDQLKPVGQGNPPVHLYATGLTHARPVQRLGAEQQHVKMRVTDGAAVLEAVWWKAGNEALPTGRFDLAFAPEVNRYNGTSTVQLRVLDWRPSE